MSTPAEDRFEAAIERAKEQGYTERDGDGRWVTPGGQTLDQGVDPKPVQEAAIKLGFERATEAEGFDIWTVVERSLVREGDHINVNFERVVEEFQRQSEDVAKEVARQLEAMGEDLEAAVPDE